MKPLHIDTPIVSWS